MALRDVRDRLREINSELPGAIQGLGELENAARGAGEGLTQVVQRPGGTAGVPALSPAQVGGVGGGQRGAGGGGGGGAGGGGQRFQEGAIPAIVQELCTRTTINWPNPDNVNAIRDRDFVQVEAYVCDAPISGRRIWPIGQEPVRASTSSQGSGAVVNLGIGGGRAPIRTAQGVNRDLLSQRLGRGDVAFAQSTGGGGVSSDAQFLGGKLDEIAAATSRDRGSGVRNG